jgi:tRNA nucleotidyltransferase/poly(A) polymerase
VVSSSLREDAMTKDFTMNTVYYDVVNGIFIDPTGASVHVRRSGHVSPRTPGQALACRTP